MHIHPVNLSYYLQIYFILKGVFIVLNTNESITVPIDVSCRFLIITSDDHLFRVITIIIVRFILIF